MSERYSAHEIEARWRARWEQTDADRRDLDHAARPFYNLMEFPYPSGEGLHVGHVYTYCGADVLGRLRRMQGYDVFQPMGFDAFGIHSENYALKLGAHPAEVVPANIRRFREEQLKRLGCQFDWSREVDTTDPRYYRWTQWIFVQLYRAGLAYQAEAPVNWCPSDQTVLANEQVVDGRCERCDTPIQQRVMRQWFLRITAYADRLLDFSQVDFPEMSIKRQSAWIGRSDGAEIDVRVGAPPGAPASEARTITVFTTRPDTIFGATCIVLAPEHPLALAIATPQRRDEVAAYIARAERRLERERLIGEQKTGVDTGAAAVNPATGQPIPVWVADYVLGRYGSGAIMAVPAHDERDHEFARTYGLPIVAVVAPAGAPAHGAGHGMGGNGEDGRRGGSRTAPTSGPDKASAGWPGSTSDRQVGDGAGATPYVDDGALVGSGRFSGMESAEARPAIVAWLAERGAARPRTTYRLRDWLISRQRYWGPPIPIVYCDVCGTQPVPEDQLPVLLPVSDNIRPGGRAPLEAVESFVQTTCPQCGGPARRETDVSDNFLDSAWYFLRYTSTEFDDRPWDAGRVQRWMPVDQYAGGPEHTTMHHLYARFLTMALHDLGHLPFAEPFRRLRLHGMITKDGAKMSKSRGNVVTPDRYIAQHGADIFRMYMLFVGPWEEGGDFSDAGVSGVARFVARLWDLVTSAPAPADGGAEPGGGSDGAAERRRHRLVARVTQAIESLRFHVAIAALMAELGALRDELGQLSPQQRRRVVETLTLLLAPLAPHLAEELWARLGGGYSVHDQPWPAWDPALLEEEQVELPVQVDGRVRDRIAVAAGADEGAIRERALASQRVQAALAGRQPRRVVVVAGRVVNVVTEG